MTLSEKLNVCIQRACERLIPEFCLPMPNSARFRLMNLLLQLSDFGVPLNETNIGGR